MKAMKSNEVSNLNVKLNAMEEKDANEQTFFKECVLNVQ